MLQTTQFFFQLDFNLSLRSFPGFSVDKEKVPNEEKEITDTGSDGS